MSFDKKTLRDLARFADKSWDPNKGTLGDCIADTIENAQDMARAVDGAKRERIAILERHGVELAEIEGKIHRLRAVCCHPSRTYYGDPSGGSDSYHECNVCGEQL